ncbi:MAG: LamG domain-containing protein [Candidatus Latescibacteria bacterium]|nr:LamG domain-containing protein [Candidatus Latescibacterota bacterium]
MRRTLVFLAVLMGLAGGGALQAQEAGELSMNVLYLDGKSGYVALPSGMFDGLREATVEAWVKWEQFNDWARVFDFGREKNAVLVLNEKRSSTVQFAIYDRKGKDHRTRAEKLIAPGVWTHLAAVCGPRRDGILRGRKAGGFGPVRRGAGSGRRGTELCGEVELARGRAVSGLRGRVPGLGQAAHAGGDPLPDGPASDGPGAGAGGLLAVQSGGGRVRAG